MTASPSRIAAARARAAAAKNWLAAAAIALFAATMIAVRPGVRDTPSQSTQATSSSRSASDDSFDQGGGGDYFNSGTLAPSQSAPQVSTGGS